MHEANPNSRHFPIPVPLTASLMHIRTCLVGDQSTSLAVSYDTVRSWLLRSSGGLFPEP